MAKENDARSTKTTMEITLPGGGKMAEGGMLSEGEGMPVGTRYTAILNQRGRKLGGRNEGLDLSRPSANPGMVTTVGQGVRKTGRI
jgi:hypothetical protein